MTILKETLPTAKKEHICDWCGNTIPVGETYKYLVWVDMGDFNIFKLHIGCNSQWEYTLCNDDMSDMTMDEVRECYEDYHKENYNEGWDK